MVLRSQNGWSANDRSKIATYTTISGAKLPVRKGDVAAVLIWVANQFNATVEKIDPKESYGYAERKIRGSATTLSNHASGTAIDLNSSKHWLGDVGTFTAKQRSAIRAILNTCGGVVRWGGDYKGRKDEMHFEINAGSEKVATLARKLKSNPKPVASSSSSGSTWKKVEYGDTLRRGTYGAPVGQAQRYLNIKDDNYFGPDMEKAVRAYQGSHGLKVDAVIGPDTWKMLKAKPVPKPKPKAQPTKAKAKAPAGWHLVKYGAVLKQGDYGQPVGDVQDMLGIKRDFAYGPDTAAAVRAFQKKYKLKYVDAKVGNETWTALKAKGKH